MSPYAGLILLDFIRFGHIVTLSRGNYEPSKLVSIMTDMSNISITWQDICRYRGDFEICEQILRTVYITLA